MSFISGIPKNIICFFGRILGTLIYHIDIPHKRIVTRNLKFVYPEWSEEEVCKVSRRIFRNLGITILEILQMAFFSKEDFLTEYQNKGRRASA